MGKRMKDDFNDFPVASLFDLFIVIFVVAAMLISCRIKHQYDYQPTPHPVHEFIFIPGNLEE